MRTKTSWTVLGLLSPKKEKTELAGRCQPKNPFKLCSNRILINFIKPNLFLDFKLSQRNWFQQMDFNQKWSKLINFFDINWLFGSFNQLFPSLNWLFWSFNWLFQSLNLSFNRNISNLDQNRDCRLDFVVGFRIGPKSTMEIDRLEIWIVDDSICKP